MALTNIEYGSLASSDVMNKNFIYLDNKITETSDTITTTISSILSNIATINSRLSDLSEEINDCTEEFDTKLDEAKSKTKILVSKSNMVPNWSACAVIGEISSYQAPLNGYILVLPGTSGKGTLTVNGVTVNMKTRENSYDNAGQLVAIPVQKNDVVTSTVDLANAYFLPAAEISVDGF